MKKKRGFAETAISYRRGFMNLCLATNGAANDAIVLVDANVLSCVYNTLGIIIPVFGNDEELGEVGPILGSVGIVEFERNPTILSQNGPKNFYVFCRQKSPKKKSRRGEGFGASFFTKCTIHFVI